SGYLLIGSSTTVFTPPSSLQFTAVQISSLTFSWQGSTGPTIEYVAELAPAGFASVQSSTTAGLSAGFIGLSLNANYSVRVRIHDLAGGSYSPYSSTI